MDQSARIKLNLGASDDRREGFVSVDIAPPADEIADLREQWPWQNGSVEEILAKDVLEHIGDGYRLHKTFVQIPNYGQVLTDVELEHVNGWIHCMNEAHRVLKPGGRFEIIVPCLPGIAPYVDPTHQKVWCSDFRYYVDERWIDKITGERGRLGPAYGITALFRTVGGRSGVDWTPIAYAPDAPERRKLFLILEAVK